LLLSLCLFVIPAISNAQKVLEGSYNTANKDSLFNYFISEKDTVAYYSNKSDSIKSYRIDLAFEENGNRSLLVTTDKNGNIWAITVIENRWSHYTVEIDTTLNKIKNFKTVFNER
jgi:hypothetical protein